MKPWVRFIPDLLFFVSCKTTAPPYPSNFPLTSEQFISRDKVFRGHVPQGWFSSTDDSLASALVVWLVKEDYSAVITLRQLFVDKATAQHLQNNGLETLAQISFAFEKERSPNVTFAAHPKEFSLNGSRFCGYEVTDGEISKRVVVFGSNGKYYECEAFPTKGNWSSSELAALFVIQQTVLSSLQRVSPD